MKEKGAWSDGRGPLGTGGVTMKAARAAAVSAHLEGGAGLEGGRLRAHVSPSDRSRPPS